MCGIRGQFVRWNYPKEAGLCMTYCNTTFPVKKNTHTQRRQYKSVSLLAIGFLYCFLSNMDPSSIKKINLRASQKYHKIHTFSIKRIRHNGKPSTGKRKCEMLFISRRNQRLSYMCRYVSSTICKYNNGNSMTKSSNDDQSSYNHSRHHHCA